MNQLSRFLSHVIKTQGCWEWIGCKSGGYGRIWIKKNSQWVKSWAHRMAWEMFRGPIPKGLFVCHACDNPSCVNPDHLWLGTNSENTKDMWSKGRGIGGLHPNMSLYKSSPKWKSRREKTLKN